VTKCRKCVLAVTPKNHDSCHSMGMKNPGTEVMLEVLGQAASGLQSEPSNRKCLGMNKNREIQFLDNHVDFIYFVMFLC
jgi:hypothetical protein